jgi:hypothetical protein
VFSRHEKNVFFSCVDEHMRESMAGDCGAVECSQFAGEIRQGVISGDHANSRTN